MVQEPPPPLGSLYAFLQSALEVSVLRNKRWAAIVEKVEAETLASDRTSERIRDVEAYARYGALLETYRGTFWEIYLWLQLGVELGHFPERECVSIMEHTRDIFPSYDSAFQKVGSLFPGALQMSLVDAFRRNVYTTRANYPPFERPLAFRVPIASVLLLQSGLFNDRLVPDLTAALTFVSDEWWKRILEREVEPTLLESELSGGSPTDEGTTLRLEKIIAGFLRVIAYVANLQDCFESIRLLHDDSKTPLGRSDFVLFERRCKEICYWRFNLHRRQVRERVHQICEAISTNVIRSVDRRGSTREMSLSLDAFENGLRQLLQFWSQGVRMELTLEASE